MAIETKIINADNWSGEEVEIHVDRKARTLFIPDYDMTFTFVVTPVDEDNPNADKEISVYTDATVGDEPEFFGYYFLRDNEYVFSSYDISREGRDMYEAATKLICNLY
jgi:hypothetical protein